MQAKQSIPEAHIWVKSCQFVTSLLKNFPAPHPFADNIVLTLLRIKLFFFQAGTIFSSQKPLV